MVDFLSMHRLQDLTHLQQDIAFLHSGQFIVLGLVGNHLMQTILNVFREHVNIVVLFHVQVQHLRQENVVFLLQKVKVSLYLFLDKVRNLEPDFPFDKPHFFLLERDHYLAHISQCVFHVSLQHVLGLILIAVQLFNQILGFNALVIILVCIYIYICELLLLMLLLSLIYLCLRLILIYLLHARFYI